jgi:hypothetical protein
LKYQELRLHGFSYSNWGGFINDMKNTFGFCFNLVLVIFSWSSMKQDIVAQSTTKTGFIAASTAVNQSLWLHKILRGLQLNQATEGSINLIFSSISPDLTAQSLNQTLCTTSPFMQLIELSRARQLSVSGTIFLKIVSAEETLANCFNLAEDAIG